MLELENICVCNSTLHHRIFKKADELLDII